MNTCISMIMCLCLCGVCAHMGGCLWSPLATSPPGAGNNSISELPAVAAVGAVGAMGPL